MNSKYTLIRILGRGFERLLALGAYRRILALLAMFLAIEIPVVESGSNPFPENMTANDTVDQSFFSPNFNFQGFGLVAQTYTAGTTGNLTSINLQFFVCSICSGGNLPISINEVSGGVPTSTVLGSTILPVSTGQLIPFSLPITFPTPVPQAVGVQYALVIDFGVLGGVNVTGEFNDSGYTTGGLFSSFDGGQTWSGNAGSDISFQTNVTAAPICVTPPMGLISWWAGDGNANDIHGNNDGTLENGATFAPGLVGQAFSLDGYDDLIVVPHNSNLAFGSGQDFTIDAWINLQSPTPGNDDVIIGKGDDQNHRMGVSPNTYRLWVFRDSHAVRFDLIANDVVFSMYSNTSVPLNEWTHVSAVREGIMGYIYINGVLDASAVMTADSVANSDPLTIGGIYDTLFDPPVQPLEGFGGLIDEVEIYNRALSASEIQEIFNAGGAGKCNNNAPVAICQNVSIIADANGTADASIDNGSFDPDGDSLTITQSPPGPYSIGQTPVTLTVEDTHGVSSSCQSVVTVFYNFSGFFQPVENLPTVNLANAGSAVPVKFSLNGDQGLAIFAAGFPVSQQIACSDGATISTVEETVSTGNSGLTYNAMTGQYTYVWKTAKAWKGTCRQLIVTLSDSSTHVANFQFK